MSPTVTQSAFLVHLCEGDVSFAAGWTPTIERRNAEDMSYDEFVTDFMSCNRPVLIEVNAIHGGPFSLISSLLTCILEMTKHGASTYLVIYHVALGSVKAKAMRGGVNLG